MKYDVAAVGNALMDVLVEVEDDQILGEFGLSRGTMHLVGDDQWCRVYEQIKGRGVQMRSGGAAANTAATVALLGGSSAYCGQVGADTFGDGYRTSLKGYGVDVRLNTLNGSPTGKCLSIISSRDKERTMLTDLGCANHMEPKHLFEDIIPQSQFMYFTGYALTGGAIGSSAHRAMDVAEKHNIPVAFDVADVFVVQGFRESIEKILGRTSVVFTNEEEAKALTGCNAYDAAQILGQRVPIAVVKMGVKGALVCHNGQVTGIESRLVEARDTTGAGDSFAAGFLYGLAKKLDMVRVGRIASYVASLVVSQIGAVITDRIALSKAMEW